MGLNVRYLSEGAVIGSSLAAPIGPVGILCVRRTLEHGARHGLPIGLSAAACDLAFSSVAAFGITLVADFIAAEQYWIRLIGGLVLLGVGYSTLRTRPAPEKAAERPGSHTWSVVSTALLVFTNPLTFFGFVAAFAMIGIGDIVAYRFLGLLLVAGVFLGSLTWFVLLIGLVRFFHETVRRVALPLVNRVAGSLLVLCGLYALWNGIKGL